MDPGDGIGGRGSFLETLAADARVSLRAQILAQLAAALRAGRLAAGDRLPSARAVADRLGIHRNTVYHAYREAADRGLVSIRPGSGVYVRGPRVSGDPFRIFLVRERAAGASHEGVRTLMERWRRAIEARQVTMIGRDEALLEIWSAELGPALASRGVKIALLPSPVARRERDRLGRTVLAGTAGTLGALGPSIPRWTETFLLRPGPPPRVERLLSEVPDGAVLAVVTRAPRLAAEVRALVASRRGGDVAVVRVADPGGRGAEPRLRVARFVLADVTMRERLAGRADPRNTVFLRHLPPSTGPELAAVFGAGGPSSPRTRKER